MRVSFFDLMPFRMTTAFFVLLWTACLSVSLWVSAPASAQDIAFRQGVAEAAIPGDSSIAAFYRARSYAPLWTDPTRGLARRQALFEALDRASLHGLPTSRYQRAALLERLADAVSARDRGTVEVALSRAFVQLASDLQAGILDPGATVEAIKRKVRAPDAVQVLEEFATAEPRAFVQDLAPDTPEYRALLRSKLHLERVIADGGWGSRVPERKLALGDRGPGVVALRNRLQVMGYLGRSFTARYDRSMMTAIRRAQEVHGLEVDGVAGPSTIKELNVSAAERLQSVLVALERERWLNATGSTEEDAGTVSRQIVVNLTDFSARVYDDGAQSFYTRAVVGMNRNDRRSPEFSDVMEHMVINPTWHVPRSITVKEYLPKLRANPNAVSHLRIVNRRGQVVSRANIDFAAYSPGSFPYSLKQPPSRSNALGLVKFMFPNEYNIYLHDTPHKKLFA
ncbi:MAG: L,D-transpeptidase family protein, partial [Pseudomonadota bacterium]